MDDLRPAPGESLDKLIGSWRVFQLARGHRFSTDDLVTAWRAWKNAPEGAERLLDIGCGIGSVGLATLERLSAERPDARLSLVGVEAQDVSASLMRRSVRLNGLEDRVTVVQGDLRDPEVLPSDARFDLVTGSPPYVPVGHGVISPHPQRAHARIELRGSVYDYCAAARRWLAPGGRFCFVMLADDPRTEDAPVQAGLTVLERYEVVFGRKGTTRSFLATMVCARSEDVPEGAERRTGKLVVRGPDGEWTEDYLAFRRVMGVT